MAGRHGLILGTLVLLMSGLCIFYFWHDQGNSGLLAALAGVLVGGGIAMMGHHLRKKSRSAEGTRIVTATLLASFSSFGLFMVLAILIGIFLKHLAPPILLSALLVYLTALFYEAISGKL